MVYGILAKWKISAMQLVSTGQASAKPVICGICVQEVVPFFGPITTHPQLSKDGRKTFKRIYKNEVFKSIYGNKIYEP